MNRGETMKQRKFTTITINKNGQTYKKSVAYRSVQELAEKRMQFEKEIEEKGKFYFGDVADQWFEEHEKIVEHYTAQSYLAPLKDLKAEFGDMELKDISALNIQAFLNRMQVQGYARQTINLRKVTMSQILDYAVLHGMITFNPSKVCKVPKAPKEIRQPPSDDDIKRIHAATDGFWKRYFLLLMYTGLRREEAMALTKDDLDFENCTVRVNKVIVYESNAPKVREYTKTAAGDRFTPFPINLHTYFKDAPKGLIFGVDGMPMNKGRFDKGIAKFKKENGITCNSHQLRHYFATICHGVIDAKDAQALLGHAKVSTTLDIYTNLDQRQKQQAIQKINRYIEKGTA